MRTFILKSLIAIVICINNLTVYSQNQVTGFVTEENGGNPVSYVTVALLHPDSTLVSGSISDENGQFSMENIAEGNYLLRLSCIGYETAYLTVNIPVQNNLGKIMLAENNRLLNEITVTSKRPFITQRTDRYVVNIGENISTAGKNALEVLRQTPGVLVIGSDISAIGKSAAIYINGRPTRVSGEQLETVLSSLQGDNIDRIEVITNPSSRYDASGGIIIDIKTKKDVQLGLNGVIDAGYRQGRKDRENSGINLNYRTGKMNIFGNYGASRSNGWAHIRQTNKMEIDNVGYIFDQQSTKTTNKALYDQNYRLGFDYFINKNHTLGIFFNGSDALNNDAAFTKGESVINPTLNGVSHSGSANSSSRKNHVKQYNLNYLALFSKPGQELNIDMDYARFSSNDGESRNNEYFDPAGNRIGEIENLRNHNPLEIQILSAKADFVQPIGNGKLEIGAKTAQSQTDNDLLSEAFTGHSWENNLSQSNHFVYTEQIHAGYASIIQNRGKWDFQAGMRAEYTATKGDQKAGAMKNDTSYLNVFPTAYINYRFSETQTFNIGYRKSIYRPLYGQVNPFEISMDAYSYEKGNPYLVPMIMDNFSFTYNNAKHGLRAMISYDIRHNTISETPIQDNENKKYGLTKTNFGKNQHATAMLNYYKVINKWWMVNVMLMGEYNKNYNRDRYGVIDDEAFGCTGQLYNRITITPGLSAELTAIYLSGQKTQYVRLK
jgi:hypothetical protein